MSLKSLRRRDLPAVGDAFQRHRSIVFALCKTADTPRALGAWLRVKYSSNEVVALEPRPNDYRYDDIRSFSADYFISEYLSKYKGWKLGVNTRNVALLTFKTGEELCQSTNRRLKGQHGLKPAFNAVMLTAQRKIADLLGVCPTYFDFSRGMWGPGVTVTLKGDDATLADKLCEQRISVSGSALPYLRAELGRDLHWAQARGIDAEGIFSPLLTEFQVQDWCSISTAPKNAKTDRTIAIEPSGNIFLQKGIGSYIRSKLRKVGIDLNDQTVNQELAYLGSKTLDLATLDLKMASDLISYELVAQLLPWDWFCLLDRLRSRYYKLAKGASPTKFEKFSTMGNGFTFELESLLFWALTQSALDLARSHGRSAVYGDDIIVPTANVADVVQTLCDAGFTLNAKKSHYDSPFRESCGEHYWGGECVTPIYQKEIISGYEEAISAANRIHRCALRRGQSAAFGSNCDLLSAWKASIHGINFVDFVPLESEEDTGLAVRLADLPARRPPNGGLLVRGLRRRPISKRHVRKNEVKLALWLRVNAPCNEGVDKEPSYAHRLPEDVSPLEVTNIRRRYRLVRTTKWYPGAMDCGFSLTG